jgi:hypothetical protein
MADPKPIESALSAQTNFSIAGVLEAKALKVAAPVGWTPTPVPAPVPTPAPPPTAPNLGPLAAFTGNWTGNGFNTIFRPNSSKTPTQLPVPGVGPNDNIFELNLTDETLSFSSPLGAVPNRGFGTQADIFLNGIPYLQSINDITSGTPIGIHFEPGMWLAVPATTNPNEPFTLARMASIPHGTTVVAQGIAASISGPPPIGAVNITPFPGGNPATRIPFPSQTVTDETSFRIPQNLTGIAITQAMVTDPNTVLRNQIANQHITQTDTIFISTNPGSPISGGPIASTIHLSPNFAGGTSNIAFLQTIPSPPPSGLGPNAQSFQMDAVFWIETVQYQVIVPPMPFGTPPVVLQPVQTNPKIPLVPSFLAAIPFVPGKGFAGGTVTVTTLQIQYSQMVLLNFNGLSWPHASVATLVPADPIPIPQNLLPLA